MNKFKLTCGVCGEKFLGRTMFVRVCSAKCRQRKWRQTAKGKAQYIEYNKRYKRPEVKKICLHCKSEFLTARKNQELCPKCLKERSSYYSQKRYRKKNPEKMRMLGRTSKRAQRIHYFSECCSIEGCLNEGERHHEDYNKPLNIIWLCRKHHKELHIKTKKG